MNATIQITWGTPSIPLSAQEVSVNGGVSSVGGNSDSWTFDAAEGDSLHVEIVAIGLDGQRSTPAMLDFTVPLYGQPPPPQPTGLAWTVLSYQP